MHNDQETNTVVVASAFHQRYPNIYNLMVGECAKAKLTITSMVSDNIWIRDWAPIQALGRFIKFRYGYGSDNREHKNLRLNTNAWKWLVKAVDNNIRLDGGNIVYYESSAIMTDMIFQHNRDVKRIVPRLEDLLGLEITVVPSEPGDDIGHADGICKFTPDGKLLVHDYRMVGTKACDVYHDRLMEKLANFKTILCPLASAKCPSLSEPQFRSLFPHADTFNPGYGYYLNMLVVGKLVFVPQFNIEEDAQVLKLVKENFRGCKIVPVDCALLSMTGGLMNCIGQTYRL